MTLAPALVPPPGNSRGSCGWPRRGNCRSWPRAAAVDRASTAAHRKPADEEPAQPGQRQARHENGAAMETAQQAVHEEEEDHFRHHPQAQSTPMVVLL